MFTVCPKCALTLAVTAADLRVAQGYVRCGRCASVFNALARLNDGRQALAAGGANPSGAPVPAAAATEPTGRADRTAPGDAAASAPHTGAAADVAMAASPAAPGPAPTATPSAAPVGEAPQGTALITGDDTIPEDALEFNAGATDVNAVFVEPAPDPQWTAAADSFRTRVRNPHAAADEPQPPAPPAPVAADAAAAPLEALSGAAGMPAGLAPAGHFAVTRRWWPAGCAAATVLLLVQLVHHNREQLAATPRLNRLLTGVYAAIGAPLVPRWDVHAYEVRQLGASVNTSGAGLITVRASIRNSGLQPQPLPLLRVTLQDRFGNRVAARDIEPRSYLPGALPPSALLAAGQRVDSEMTFVDPGKEAVGFELDACLPAGGGVACANDGR